MNCRIQNREAFELIGTRTQVSMQNAGFKIPGFWRACDEDGTTQKIKSLANGQESYGVNADDYNEKTGEWSYYIAFENHAHLSECEYEIIKVPESTWAVFEADGPQPWLIQSLFRMADEWFPSSGYTEQRGPKMEVHRNNCELWIPVKKV